MIQGSSRGSLAPVFQPSISSQTLSRAEFGSCTSAVSLAPEAQYGGSTWLQVGSEDHVICALSGGVDSAVAALLVHKVLKERLHCVFVDNGLLRYKVAP